MKDSQGHDYAELLEIQEMHLDRWREKLKPDLYAAVHDYVLATNLESGPEGKHRVYRGQNLIQIIMDWPNLSSAYALPPASDVL